MSKFYNTFEFVGTLGLPKEENLVKVSESASGFLSNRMSFAIQQDKSTGAYVELFGGYSKSKKNTVFGFSKGTENVKGSKMEIDWKDRLNPSIVRKVADFSKIVVDFTIDKDTKQKMYDLKGEIRKLEFKDSLSKEEQTKLNELHEEYENTGERKEFLHTYDAIQYLKETLKNHKDKVFVVKGNINYNRHNGRIYRKFEPSTIVAISDDIENTPKKLRAKMDLYFAKGNMDDKDLEAEKLIYFDTYVRSYDSATKKDAFYPQQVVLNLSKVDLNDERIAKRVEYFKKQFEVDTKDKKKVFHQVWEVSIFRGAEKEEVTLESLTDAQREQVEFGLAKLEDFQGGYGETKEETRIVKNLLEDLGEGLNFTSGRLESEYEVDDLDSVPQVEEKIDELPEALKVESTGTVELDDMDDLFG